MSNTGSRVPQPLEDIRVLDATHLVAGPFCSMLLADAGAEVIKIERPGAGETLRNIRPLITYAPGYEVGARFLYMNRNKSSTTLDLRHPRGKAVFEELVKVSDVVVDNWGPGAMRRLGLEYDRLRSLNPSIIYASTTGYGDSDPLRGPYSDWPANNPCSQAMAGWMEITGQPDGPPQMMGDNIGDSIPAVWTAYGILLALESKRKTGLGQHVDMAMYDCMVAHSTSSVAVYQVRAGGHPGAVGRIWSAPS